MGTQPAGETCTVSNGSGAGVIAAITGVTLICAVDTYTVSGTASGLASGAQVTLNDNGADALTLTANGAFTFTTPVAYKSSYAVTVGTQPVGETCTVSSGSGSGVIANVGGIQLICAVNTYTVSGTVTGLASGAQVTLDNNGDDALTLTASGAFTFVTPVAYNGSYAVTVGTQPGIQTCTVSSGSGSAVTSNVTGISVACVTHQYTTGGAISGLTGTVVLQNNGVDTLSSSTDGAFRVPDTDHPGRCLRRLGEDTAHRADLLGRERHRHHGCDTHQQRRGGLFDQRLHHRGIGHRPQRHRGAPGQRG